MDADTTHGTGELTGTSRTTGRCPRLMIISSSSQARCMSRETANLSHSQAVRAARPAPATADRRRLVVQDQDAATTVGIARGVCAPRAYDTRGAS